MTDVSDPSAQADQLMRQLAVVISQMAQSHHALAKAMTAKRRVVRDAAGKVVGLEPG